MNCRTGERGRNSGPLARKGIGFAELGLGRERFPAMESEFSGRNCWNSPQLWPNPAHTWSKSAPAWSNSAHIWTAAAQHWPILAAAARARHRSVSSISTLVEVGPQIDELGPNTVDIGPTFVELGPGLGEMLRCGRPRPTFVEVGPDLADISRIWFRSVNAGRRRRTRGPRFCPIRTKVRSRIRSCR